MSGTVPSSTAARWRGPLVSLVWGLLSCAVVLELTLRLVGMWVEAQGSDHRAHRQRTILCVGDSYTWGVGATPDNTWPQALERLLNAQGTVRYRVVNRGMAGSNSTHLLDRLQANIDDTDPDLVILLTGSANFLWTDYGSSAFPRSVAGRAHNALHSVRLVRLGLLLSQQLAPDFEALRVRLLFRPTYRLLQRTPAQAYLEAWDLMKRERFRAALVLLEKLKEIEGEQAEARILETQAWMCLGDRHRAVQALARAQVLGPSRPWLASLIEMFRRHLDGRVDILLSAPAYDLGFGHLRAIRSTGLEESCRPVLDWMRRDMRAIMGILQRNRLRVLLLSYPNQAASLAMEEASRTYGLPLVDIEGAFRDLPHRADYFVSDGHCNDAGYQLMARTMLPTVLQLFELPPGECVPRLEGRR